MFALISLLGFQAIIKQICFLLPSLPQPPLLPSVSSSLLFSKQPWIQQHQHLLPKLPLSANRIAGRSSQHPVHFFPPPSVWFTLVGVYCLETGYLG